MRFAGMFLVQQTHDVRRGARPPSAPTRRQPLRPDPLQPRRTSVLGALIGKLRNRPAATAPSRASTPAPVPTAATATRTARGVR
jgi:hypothetical protein